VDNVNTAHGATSIVKEPIFRLADMRRYLGAQLRHNVLDNRTRIVAMGSNAALGEIVQMDRLKDVKRLKVLLDVIDQRREEAD